MQRVVFRFVVIMMVFTVCWSEAAMATEEAKYTVLEKRGDFELRRYEPQIVAETVVRGDFSSVGNEAFQRLFGYISGGNRKSRSIPMTTPVSQESQSEKIAMTAPVSQEQVGDQWRIAFVMPAQYKLADLPEPNDSRVSLREIPGRTIAAFSYSGTWSKKRYDKKMEILLGSMNELGLRPIGEPVFARYNPPFTPWFLRRNEILIPVERP